MFVDREDAAQQLAERLKQHSFHDPIVLAIPRGGVVTGAVLARELGAELDVVLSRKLRAPHQPEYALGAISESGDVFLNPDIADVPGCSEEYLAGECQRQMEEISRRRKLLSGVLGPAKIAGRSVIVTDDGIATGATMIAALQSVRKQGASELIVAVPVASPARLAEVARWCDAIVYLAAPRTFHAISQFYGAFPQIEDSEVVRILRGSRHETHVKR